MEGIQELFISATLLNLKLFPSKRLKKLLRSPKSFHLYENLSINIYHAIKKEPKNKF